MLQHKDRRRGSRPQGGKGEATPDRQRQRGDGRQAGSDGASGSARSSQSALSAATVAPKGQERLRGRATGDPALGGAETGTPTAGAATRAAARVTMTHRSRQKWNIALTFACRSCMSRSKHKFVRRSFTPFAQSAPPTRVPQFTHSGLSA